MTSTEIVRHSNQPISQAEHSLISADQQERLDTIAANIRKRFKRLFKDIYETGKELLEAKAVFGWGQTPAFLHWAQEKTGLSISLCYYMMAVGRAFLPFEKQEVLKALNRVDATLLYRIAADSTPKAARTIFVQQVLEGKMWTLESVEALIQEHQKTVDLEQDERFLRYREEVQNWGRLERCIEDEDHKFYLIDRSNIVRFFRNYQDLMTQYKAWRLQVFQAQFAQLKSQLEPHWSIQHYPVPKQPFRLSVQSNIDRQSISFVVPNPLTLERWWNEKGQALTERLTTTRKTRRSNKVDPPETQDLAIDKPTCLNCTWHDSQHEGNRFGVWCSFYREAFSDDRVIAMPQHCQKWKSLEEDTLQSEISEFQATRQFLQSQPNPEEEYAAVSYTTPSPITHTIDVPSVASSHDDELEAILQYIQYCSEAQLQQLNAAIAHRLKQN